jgi:hypothetical protein
LSLFADPSASPTATLPPPDKELIKLIGERFVSRKDVKAQQQPDGSWVALREPFTMQDFTDHLSGKRTFGHYLLGSDDTCKFFAFDIDLDKAGYWLDLSATDDDFSNVMESGIKCNPREVWAAQQPAAAVEYFTIGLRTLAEGLAHMIDRILQIPVAVMDSGGKGYHVYGFTGSMPAAAVREAAHDVMQDLGLFEPTRGQNFWKPVHHHSFRANYTIEVFPKQDSIEGKDMGNLLRLPMGVNRKTKRRARFLACKGGYDKVIEMDPMRALAGDLPWE